MKEKNKIKILNTEPNRQTLICFLDALGQDTTGLNQEILENRHIKRNKVEIKPVKQQGWFKWGAEQLGLASGEIDLELSNVSMQNLDIENLPISKNLKKVLARTLTYGEEKSKDTLEKIKSFFKGDFKVRSIDDHRYFIEILIIAFLIKIANAKDIGSKIALNRQLLGFFDLLLPRMDLIFTNSTDEARKSLAQTIRQNIKDTQEELINLETQKQREIFRNSLEKLSVDNVLGIGEEIDNLIITLFIPGNHPKDLRIESEKYFSEFEKYRQANDLPDNFENFTNWFKTLYPNLDNGYSKILLNEKYFNILKRALLWGSNVNDLCQSYSSTEKFGQAELSKQIKALTQPLNETEIEALFSTIELNEKGKSITPSKPSQLIQNVKDIIDIKFEFAKITHALSLIKDLERSAGEMSTFFARESLKLVFDQMSAHLINLSVKITNLKDSLRNFQEENSKELNRQTWTYRSTAKMNEVSNRLYPIIQDLLEASRNLSNQTHPKEIQRNLSKVKDLIWQLNIVSELLTDNPDILAKIKKDTETKLKKIALMKDDFIENKEEPRCNIQESYVGLEQQKTRQINSLFKENEDLKNQIEDLKNQIEDLNHKIKQDNYSIDDFEKSMVIVNDEKLELSKKIEDQTKELSDFRESIIVVQDEKESLLQRIDYLNEQLIQAQKRKDELDNLLKNVTEQLGNLEEKDNRRKAITEGLNNLLENYSTYNTRSREAAFFERIKAARHGESGITAADNTINFITGRVIHQEQMEGEITFDSLDNALEAGIKANPRGGKNGHSWNTYLKSFQHELDLLNEANKNVNDDENKKDFSTVVNEAAQNVINKLVLKRTAEDNKRDVWMPQNA